MKKVTVTTTYNNLTQEGVESLMNQMKMKDLHRHQLVKGEEVVYQESFEEGGPGHAITIIKLENQS